jgi:hypothetical protein
VKWIRTDERKLLLLALKKCRFQFFFGLPAAVKTETAIREDGANAQSCVQEAKVETRTKWAVNPKSELHRFCEMLWICNRFGVSRLVLGACLFIEWERVGAWR